MSGSPRLNSTWEEAADVWHRELLVATPCYAVKEGALRAACLRNMTAEDLIAAVPSNWDPKNGWSFKSYQRNYRYAPLLVIDGDVLPFNYLAAGRNAALTPTIIGVTRQEVDFSPGSSLYCARDLGVMCSLY